MKYLVRKKILFWILLIGICYSLGFIVSVYNYPRISFYQIWKKISLEVGVNQWDHKRDLCDSSFTMIPRSNNDTINSMAALDLDDGPLVIELPFSESYWSVAFIQENTNVFAVIKSRDNTDGKDIKIILSKKPVTKSYGLQVIQYPDRKSWLLARFLVKNPKDLSHVHDLQNHLKITPLIQYHL